MHKTDIRKAMQNDFGSQHAFSLNIRGIAVDVILFTNPNAAFYASAHTHSGHEFHYIQEGSSILRIGSDNYDMRPGNCYLVAKGTFHDIQMRTPTISRIGALIIPHTDGFFEKLPPFIEFRAEGERKKILELLLSALLRRQSADFESYVGACVTLLLLSVLEKVAPEPLPVSEPVEMTAAVNRSLETMKQEVLSYIANNLATASLEELAALLHISTRQTARFLQKNLGDTFSSLLRKHRIECAKSLMLSGNIALEEIAFLSGYRSYKGFHTAFCMETGINPKAYRSKGI